MAQYLFQGKNKIRHLCPQEDLGDNLFFFYFHEKSNRLVIGCFLAGQKNMLGVDSENCALGLQGITLRVEHLDFNPACFVKQ